MYNQNSNEYNYNLDGSVQYTAPKAISEQSIAMHLARVMGMMFFGLVITVITSLIAVNSYPVIYFVAGTSYGVWVIFALQIGIVLALSAGLNKLSNAMATFFFLLYSAITGVSLSVIYLVFPIDSIIYAFMSTAVIFFVMAVYGYVTKKDLSGIGSILLFSLFGLIVAALFNIRSTNFVLDMVVSGIGVIVFMGLVAFDTQKIKTYYTHAVQTYGLAEDDSQVKKLAIHGALTLYLDFINIFLYLVRIFASRRD